MVGQNHAITLPAASRELNCSTRGERVGQRGLSACRPFRWLMPIFGLSNPAAHRGGMPSKPRGMLIPRHGDGLRQHVPGSPLLPWAAPMPRRSRRLWKKIIADSPPNN
jgi:hypothetical protein